MNDDRLKRVREMYEAFASGNRDVVDAIFTDDFRFSSPVDPELDRTGYFERCWPGSGQGQRFDFVRMVPAGDEVIVTYEMTGQDGARGRNTEVFTFAGDRIRRAEVYFGWALEAGS
jgi:SnoaL-like domain